MDAYVGGAYEVAFGEGYISYDEWAGNYWTNIWEELDGSGSGYWWGADALAWWMGNGAPTNNADVSTDNYWEDSTWRFNVIDYLPSNIADQAGLVELYEQELFSF
jgi:hypothetical protein